MLILDENCSFNRIYKLSDMYETKAGLVGDLRVKAARALSESVKERGLAFDFVVPIPNTGKFYTNAISRYLRVPEIEVFAKVKKQRTLGLDVPLRTEYYDQSLVVNSFALNLIRGKSLLFVDEALISGLTAKAVSRLAKGLSLSSFSFGFISPPNYLACPFSHIKGKDRVFSLEKILLEGLEAVNSSLCSELGAQNILFNSFESFKSSVGGTDVCTLCFFNRDFG